MSSEWSEAFVWLNAWLTLSRRKGKKHYSLDDPVAQMLRELYFREIVCKPSHILKSWDKFMWAKYVTYLLQELFLLERFNLFPLHFPSPRSMNVFGTVSNIAVGGGVGQRCCCCKVLKCDHLRPFCHNGLNSFVEDCMFMCDKSWACGRIFVHAVTWFYSFQ